MSSDLNNGFEKLVRNKLEDHRIPVEPDSWNAVEKSLIRRRRSKYLYITTSVVAAAAVVLLVITLNLPSTDIQQNDKTTVEVPKDSTPPEKQSGQQNAVSNTEAKETTQETAATQSTPAVPEYSATVVVQVEKPDTDTDTDIDTDTEDPPVRKRLDVVSNTISGVSISLSTSNKLQLPNNMRIAGTLDRKTEDKKDEKDNNSLQDNQKDMTAYLDKTESNNKKWSVLMSFGAGNYQAPVNNKNADLVMAAPLLASSNSENYIKNKYKDEIGVPDNAGSQYGLPLSAKFIVRKDINTRWAIESGLSYTYLSTKYKWNRNTVNQQLHYIGIPLNAICYVVSRPAWDIYTSAGGMVEKGVYASINRSDNRTTKANMSGLQWSVNGAVGVTYKLRKGVGLFFEPQIGYFFDNGQPESIRTAGSVSFGLGIGLRFNF
ncbi:MAG: PorT family protein [Prevotellaceae bacterium]|jgi:hypothetical protein|nr:PorT family protein [Prevotellaceae bacterium]